MKTNDVKKPQKKEEKGLTVEQKRRMAKKSIPAIKSALIKFSKQQSS